MKGDIHELGDRGKAPWHILNRDKDHASKVLTSLEGAYIVGFILSNGNLYEDSSFSSVKEALNYFDI